MEVLMAYKPTVQIEKELKSDKAWQKAVEPKAKAMIKQAHNTFHDNLEKIGRAHV